MDDVIGSITGTATFDRVLVESADNGELYEVTGYYADSTTVYRTHYLRIGGLEVDGQIEGELLLETPNDDEPVWAVAREDGIMTLSSEKPEAEE